MVNEKLVEGSRCACVSVCGFLLIFGDTWMDGSG